MKEKITTLDKLKKGQKGRVLYLQNKNLMKRRLMDIGLIEGATVECNMISPLGDPKAYLICGAVIALRKEDAACIGVYLI